GVIDLSAVGMTEDVIREISNIYIVACGSAWHVGMVAQYVFEDLAKIPVRVELASEFRYRKPLLDKNGLVVVISQSGETADSLAALREAKQRGIRTLAIVNVVGSSIARLVDYPIYTWAGPEIAVATTEGYITQVVIFDMLAVWLAKKLGTIDEAESKRLTLEILSIPERAQRTIHLNSRVESLADTYHDMGSVFFIGRNLDYAVGLEASLKLKEISYIHSEAYAAGELKHGTIALIDEGQLVLALCCHEALFDKTVSNIQQVKARGAEVLAVSLEGNKQIFKEADEVLTVPNTDPILMPVIEVIPLQLFAYYVAKKNGCDIDKPKNLAKSVTVE
ncbi:MAG: isomerizing glutamine--fructose-6-phosphate transaminase, partial [Clostridia bacterium]|nr:isomerizing glutamine--fructose-6-phosphate transaminase [Clostridia bacterium]